jgi:hypothetical protein
MIEKLFALGTVKCVSVGQVDRGRYEKFSIQEVDFTERAYGKWPWFMGWLCLRGMTSCGDRGEKSRDILWLCFPGLSSAEHQESFSIIPRRIDLVPKQGIAIVFNGPTAIAGYSPEQCIRVTEAVTRCVERIIENHPGKRIRVFCFSAGTHLGFYVANQLGRQLGRPIDKLVAVSAGDSIAYGIFSTWVTESLAADLERRGITKEIYDQAIRPYTQRANIDHLPSGSNLVIHAGTADSFIPIDRECGTNDLVERLKKAGKNPTYILHADKNHVTLALTLAVAAKCGFDPHVRS